MTTAAKPRAKPRMTAPRIQTVINASEMDADEMPDVSFRGSAHIGDIAVKVTYCIWPGTEDVLGPGIRDSYLGIYFEEIDTSVSDTEWKVFEGADMNHISPDSMRALARILTAVADQSERDLPHHLARINKAYDTIGDALDELYAE